MFFPFKYKDQIVGYSAQVREYKIFYGTRYLKRSDLRELFPDYQFCFVKQVHGNKVVEAQSVAPLVEADGLWTFQKRRALVVQTADCLPIFLWSGSMVCGVHAGWRGVQQQIVLKAIQCFPSHLRSDLEMSVGPHIDQDHFEVEEDVAQKLAQSSPHGSKCLKIGQKTNKYKVSLIHIVQDQVASQVQLKNLYLYNKSTFLTEIFHSYRRSAEKLLGQSSFIVRI